MPPKKLILYQTEIKTPPLSSAARVEVGQFLRKLLEGESLAMPHSRPMSTIGARVHELRVNDENQTWRLIYRLDKNEVLVVDLFSKKTEQTALADVRRSQGRLCAYDASISAQTKGKP